MALLLVLILTGTAVIGTTGCGNSGHARVRQPPTVVYPAGELVAREEPPPPRTESVTSPPDESHVWVEGYWTYSNGKWVWIPGHWEVRPRPNVSWVPSHWDKTADGGSWVWTPGHWE